LFPCVQDSTLPEPYKLFDAIIQNNFHANYPPPFLEKRSRRFGPGAGVEGFLRRPRLLHPFQITSPLQDPLPHLSKTSVSNPKKPNKKLKKNNEQFFKKPNDYPQKHSKID
jgi:hypothetical protein